MNQQRQAMMLDGYLLHIGEVVNGTSQAGKEWSKQEFVVQYDFGLYPKYAHFQLMGKLVGSLPPQGTPIRVAYEIESREYQGRWYTNLRAYSIQALQVNNGVPTQQMATIAPSQPIQHTQQAQNTQMPAPNDPLPF